MHARKECPPVHVAPATICASPAASIPAGVEATLVSLETRRKQADALRLYFAGAGTLGRLSASANQLLFMAGSQDRIFPTATQYLATAGIPDSWVVTVPDASHVSSLACWQTPIELDLAWSVRCLPSLPPDLPHSHAPMHHCRACRTSTPPSLRGRCSPSSTARRRWTPASRPASTPPRMPPPPRPWHCPRRWPPLPSSWPRLPDHELSSL